VQDIQALAVMGREVPHGYRLLPEEVRRYYRERRSARGATPPAADISDDDDVPAAALAWLTDDNADE
jgi:hypothetical protein